METSMEWLNYHHLLYFHTVAREGSISRASRVLRLAQPTISGQIRKLEHVLGEKLFERQGRNLVLTEVGQAAYRYADEIFSLGQELLDTLHGRPTARAPRLQIGISDIVPKLVAHRLIAAAGLADQGTHLVLREGKTEDLLVGLASQAFDVVIADVPLASHIRVKAFNHRLGESGITFFASPELARHHRRGFPKSLDGAPMLLPTDNTSLRRSLEKWFQEIEVRPRIVAEIEDSALLKVFGQHGSGIFPVPRIVAADVRRQYGAHVVGSTDKVLESFFAITIERRIKDPAVAAIAAAARTRLFG
jgi:LysR family transcriptional activator of nhaA